MFSRTLQPIQGGIPCWEMWLSLRVLDLGFSILGNSGSSAAASLSSGTLTGSVLPPVASVSPPSSGFVFAPLEFTFSPKTAPEHSNNSQLFPHTEAKETSQTPQALYKNRFFLLLFHKIGWLLQESNRPYTEIR